MIASSTRVAMISGANRGIGAAIARHLQAAGWTLSLGVRTPSGIDASVGTLVQAYDAHDRGSEKAWVAATVERFGRVDAVVANAGIHSTKSVVEAEDAEIDDLYEVNLKAPLRLVRAAWPWLITTGQGRVVTVVWRWGERVKTGGAGGDGERQNSAAFSFSNARARWLIASFTAGAISPKVSLRPSGVKIGS